ncbi:hypothetical protein M501DRAFT_69609 [Patellaria atrata CBS 101060]|uniref:Heterokaryon incompatibility domain-containing protein n=1 Tax=Patellaria atrata CBS 101060 TaxID=1346257 RepID=A0A9P4SIN5_9PEZI|nr:hypothetical protein M501DRAFT_69609 [Patellaria atrata CBS 101060]
MSLREAPKHESDLPPHASTSKSPLTIPLFTLFSRPWFEHAWVMQEVSMSSELLMHHGRFQSHWNLFAQGANCILNHPAWPVSRGRGGFLSTACINTSLHAYARQQISTVARCDLSLLLVMMRENTKATDPRDKVFSLLGLVKEQFQQQIPIDYAARVETVYTQATISALTPNTGFHILRAAGQKNLKNTHLPLPSWIPDYSLVNQGILGFGWKPYTAGGTEPPLFWHEKDISVLGMYGRLCGRVNDMIPPRGDRDWDPKDKYSFSNLDAQHWQKSYHSYSIKIIYT